MDAVRHLPRGAEAAGPVQDVGDLVLEVVRVVRRDDVEAALPELVREAARETRSPTPFRTSTLIRFATLSWGDGLSGASLRRLEALGAGPAAAGSARRTTCHSSQKRPMSAPAPISATVVISPRIAETTRWKGLRLLL